MFSALSAETFYQSASIQTATQECQYAKPIRTEKYFSLFLGSMLKMCNEMNSQSLSTKFQIIMFSPLFHISEK